MYAWFILATFYELFLFAFQRGVLLPALPGLNKRLRPNGCPY